MSRDILTQLLGFVYSAAHYLGAGIIALIQKILPMAKDLQDVADPVGYLAILTIFVIITATVKKVAVAILLAGWALILLRIVLMAVGV